MNQETQDPQLQESQTTPETQEEHPSEAVRTYRFEVMLPADHPSRAGAKKEQRRYFILDLTQDQYEDYQGLKARVHAKLEEMGITKADRPYWNEHPFVPAGFEEKLQTAIGASDEAQFIAHYPHSWQHRHYKRVEVNGVPCEYQSFSHDQFIKWAPAISADASFMFNTEYQYVLKVGGKLYMNGDIASMGVIFNNLTGSNFDRKDNPAAEHRDWLNFMIDHFKTDLPAGATVEIISRDGSELDSGTIGGSLPQAAAATSSESAPV